MDQRRGPSSNRNSPWDVLKDPPQRPYPNIITPPFNPPFKQWSHCRGRGNKQLEIVSESFVLSLVNQDVDCFANIVVFYCLPGKLLCVNITEAFKCKNAPGFLPTGIWSPESSRPQHPPFDTQRKWGTVCVFMPVIFDQNLSRNFQTCLGWDTKRWRIATGFSVPASALGSSTSLSGWFLSPEYLGWWFRGSGEFKCWK